MGRKLKATQNAMADALNRAIKSVGSGSELARGLNITRQAISQWEITPIERVLEVEAVTGVSRFELRPDIFSVPLAQKAQERIVAQPQRSD